MKIFISGATGMVGRNIINYYNSNISNNKNYIGFTIDSPNKKQLNLLDQTAVKNYILQTKPDIVIHCAGLVGGIQANIDSPYDFCYQNLQMGLNIINASFEASVKKLITFGSSCMYPKDAKNPLTEDLILTNTLEPTNEGYAIAKIAVSKLTKYIKEQYGFNYKTIIPCNLYGLWDNFHPTKSHMIPAAIRKIHYAKQNNSNQVEIWGDGEARREFLFAEDLADFIFFTLSNNNYNNIPDVINIGLGVDYSINEFYQAIKEVADYHGDFIHDLSKPSGMKKKQVDITKQQQLGWQPKHDLLSGLKKTYAFFIKSYNN